MVIENAKLKLVFAIPTGAPITVANNATEMLPLVADKTINQPLQDWADCPKKEQYIY